MSDQNDPRRAAPMLAFFSSVALIGPGLGGCSHDSTDGSPEPDATDVRLRTLAAAGHTHDLVVDWAPAETPDELAAGSDAIVVGQVVRQRHDVLRSHDPHDPRVYADFPITISTLVVEIVVSAQTAERPDVNASPAPGRRIEIQELGGLAEDGCRVEPADKPLLPPGARLVLFLDAATVAHGRAAVTAPRYNEAGGRATRFEVVGDVAVPLSGDDGVRPLAAFLDDLAVRARGTGPRRDAADRECPAL